MKLNNDPKLYPFVLAPNLVKMLDHLLEKNAEENVCINFRDPEYSAEQGGFHPVEIHVNSKGILQTVTDFSYAGCPPFVELAIELDWSFEQGYFRQFDDFHEILVGQSLFYLFAENFCSYYDMGVYQVELSQL